MISKKPEIIFKSLCEDSFEAPSESFWISPSLFAQWVG